MEGAPPGCGAGPLRILGQTFQSAVRGTDRAQGLVGCGCRRIVPADVVCDLAAGCGAVDQDGRLDAENAYGSSANGGPASISKSRVGQRVTATTGTSHRA